MIRMPWDTPFNMSFQKGAWQPQGLPLHFTHQLRPSSCDEGAWRPQGIATTFHPSIVHGQSTTNQRANQRNFLPGWWQLHVNVRYSQAESAASAAETRRHRGSDEAWRSSTRKNAPLARRASNTSLSTPLKDASGSVYRTE